MLGSPEAFSEEGQLILRVEQFRIHCQATIFLEIASQQREQGQRYKGRHELGLVRTG